jgi:hypothetical protein
VDGVFDRREQKEIDDERERSILKSGACATQEEIAQSDTDKGRHHERAGDGEANCATNALVTKDRDGGKSAWNVPNHLAEPE